MRWIRLTCLAVALLSGCGSPGPRPSPDTGPVPESQNPAFSYAIDAARSELAIRVYRAGPLARFGHNHVIVARNLVGQVSVGGPASAASLVLSIPVADLEVDDPAARAAAGGDFTEAVAEDARTGTRRNMQGAAVLDAGRFPRITVATLGVRPVGPERTASTTLRGQWIARLSVDIAGHRSVVEAPFMLEAIEGGLIASGKAVLRQSAMGLTPFSVMLGALQVEDELSVEYRLVAVPVAPVP